MRLFSAAVIFQVLVIAAVVTQKESVLRAGRLIRMELRPRDPRSMLQGDYVILTYPGLQTDPRAPEDQRPGRITVVLREAPQGDLFRYHRVHDPNIPLEPNEVLLSGQAASGAPDFGIGQYFVPAGTGRQVERTMKFARIKVDQGGVAIVVGVE